jgi:hypothetical protein
MAKASSRHIIDEIIKHIEKGEKRGKVLGIIGKKWEISRTSFDRIWKIANIEASERQRKGKEAADKAYINAKADAAKKAVMSKQERLEYLTNIIKGEIKTPKLFFTDGLITKYLVEADCIERIKAISELNKMEGDYAPAKVAQTDKDGNDVPFNVTLNIS